jgi:beta-phosphoglucomutase
MSGLIEAVLFDFDGVLMDSEPVHFAAWQEALEPLGIHVPWSVFTGQLVGASEPVTMGIFARLADPPMDIEKIRARYPVKKALFQRRMLAAPFAPGMREFMASLEGRYRMAVVSSSSRAELEPLLERGGLSGFLGATVFGEDVECQKPAPDPYLLAARLLRVRLALVVEDSDAGMESARRAGFPAVRIPSPARTVELVAQALDAARSVSGQP